MYVLIAGGGRTGAQLAKYLFQHNHRVIVVDDRKEVLTRIHREIPSEIILEGNPIDPEVLSLSGIENVDVIAACTSSDQINLTLCYLAREKYTVTRTIARINNPMNAWLFNKLFNVDVAINQADLMARIIMEEMSMGDMMTLLKLKKGNYSLVEEKIPEHAQAIGTMIKDLKLPEQCVIAAIIREGKVTLPRGITKLIAGDEVLAITDSEGAQQLIEIFKPSNNIK